MENSQYSYLHNLPKSLNTSHIDCAPYGKQAVYNGHGTLQPTEKFRIVQNRKGHRRSNNLTYLLFHKQINIMIRIDIHGQSHEGVATPHVHIFDDKHHNGEIAIPLDNLPNYDTTDELIQSLYEFLKYNHFETKGIQIASSTV